VENSPSSFAILFARRRRHDGARSADACREDRGALSGAAERGFDHLHPVGEGERRRRGDVRPAGMQGTGTFPKTEAFNAGTATIGNRGLQARAALPRATASCSSATKATGQKPRWQRVVFRPITSAGRASRRCSRATSTRSRNVPIQDLVARANESELQVGRGCPPASSTCISITSTMRRPASPIPAERIRS